MSMAPLKGELSPQVTEGSFRFSALCQLLRLGFADPPPLAGAACVGAPRVTEGSHKRIPLEIPRSFVGIPVLLRQFDIVF